MDRDIANNRLAAAASRTLGVLSIMFTIAHTWGVLTDSVNPLWTMKRFKEETRERYLTTERNSSVSARCCGSPILSRKSR